MAKSAFYGMVCAISMQSFAQGQLLCAPPAEALCADDMAVVNTTDFAQSISRAGIEKIFKKIPGTQALEAVLGKGLLSAGCLVCQGAAIDCAADQRDCMSLCMQSSCGDACRTCMTRACSIEAACGGVPGKTIQEHVSCGNTNDRNKLTVMSDQINLTFTGTCSATYDGNASAPQRTVGEESARSSPDNTTSEAVSRSSSTAAAYTALSGADQTSALLGHLFLLLGTISAALS
eukprot:TRINITY_DN38018_c0_g1_i1.p1 TRINITY_DN38018_c0_g1~~TRINITY_DN38018_c0_g1_i1.p1  ORF type:complete len:233 (+),score=31.75 TRINITY_DN38018_c0_g1_i1:68-766(+)